MHRVCGVVNALVALPFLLVGILGVLGTAVLLIERAPSDEVLAAAATGGISLGLAYAAYTAGRVIHQGWDAPRGEARRALWICVACIVPLAAVTAIVLGQQDLVARLNNLPAPLMLFLFVMDAIALTHISRGRPVGVRTR